MVRPTMARSLSMPIRRLPATKAARSSKSPSSTPCLPRSIPDPFRATPSRRPAGLPPPPSEPPMTTSIRPRRLPLSSTAPSAAVSRALISSAAMRCVARSLVAEASKCRLRPATSTCASSASLPGDVSDNKAVATRSLPASPLPGKTRSTSCNEMRRMALLLIRSNALWTPPNTMSIILSVDSRPSSPRSIADQSAVSLCGVSGATIRASESRALESLSSPDRSGSRRTPKRTRPASAIALPSAAFFRLTSRTSSARKREASKVMRAGPTDTSMSWPANSSSPCSAATRSRSEPIPDTPIA